jgi:hypothetical protein
MITLAADCLVFRLASGENVPFSSDMISVELMGDTAQWFDPEFVRESAKAVFHYFKNEMGRQTVTVAEFAEAMEKVLGKFHKNAATAAPPPPAKAGHVVLESDLRRLACESGDGRELFFFPRLRSELRQQLQQSPRVLRFHGLRGCVKQLVGTNRWTPRCRSLEEQIIQYLRGCFSAEPARSDCAMVVE